MSCWVVPSVAAELWGIPVNDVLAKVNSGAIPTRAEYGFTLIDVAPNSPRIEKPRALEPRPLTYTPAPPPAPVVIDDDEPSDEYELGEFSWKNARQTAGRFRRPPRSENLAA